MTAASEFPPFTDRYRIVRKLEHGAAAQRTLLKQVEKHSGYVAHSAHPDSVSGPSTFEEIAVALAPVHISHIMPIEDLVRLESGEPAFVTPYYGHASGLVTLESLGAARGGRLAPEEIEAAADHILHALDDAHAQRLYNGPLEARQILIDRQGRVQIEQFGLARMLKRGVSDARLVREEEIQLEVRSVMEILFRCLTGLDSRTIGVSPSQVVSSLDPLLDEWLAAGLREGAGFESASAARAAMPEHQRGAAAKAAPSGPLQRLNKLLRFGH